MIFRLFLFAAAGTLQAQQIITTFAGTEWVFPDTGRSALTAPLSSVLNTAVDSQGRLVIADGLNHVITRVDSSGALTVIAGNGVHGFSGDGGDALRASLNQPQGIAFDANGNLHVADLGNRRIRRITPSGIITTVAGNGTSAFNGDGGPATAAGMLPWRIAFDAANALLISDFDNRRVRKVGPDGVISTIAGTGQGVFSGDGRPARETSLIPNAIHVDRSGRILLSDTENYRIYRIGTDGILTTLTGIGRRGFSGDGGPAAAAATTNIDALTTDAAGNILLADTSNRRIRRINSAGVISTIAGGSDTAVTTAPVEALRAAIGFPDSISVDSRGRIFIADIESQNVLVLSEDGRLLSLVAGNGSFKALPPGTPSPLATMTEPTGIAIAPDGSIYYVELQGHRIAKISPGGAVTLIGGNGVASCCVDDGPAANGRFAWPNALAFAPDGALIIVDGSNQKIRRIFNGTVTSIAGTTFQSGFAGDGGPATQALLHNPWGVAVDRSGNIFFADRENHRVRRIDTRGIIDTVAGNGRAGFSGDGGPATAASLNLPHALAFNAAGDLLIADFYNNRVRAVSPAGVIRTFAGNGTAAYSGDGGPATAASISGPFALATDPRGNTYLSHDYSVIRRIDSTGVISTLSGQNFSGFSGDGGPPQSATLNVPYGLAVDPAGNLYIADSFNHRIRVIRNVSLTTTLSPSPINITAVAGSGSTVPARVTVASSVNGIPFTASAAYGQSPGNWLTVNASGSNAPATLTLTANASNLGPGRYTATLNVVTNPAGSSNPVSVVLTVDDVPASLTLSAESMSFSRNEGAAADSNVLEVRNSGGGLLSYQATATTAGTPQWLKLASAEGALRAGQVAAINVTADPAGLKAGTYLGSITVIAGPVRKVVPVTLSVRAGRRTILVSQSGLTFTALAGGGSPTPQKIGILNIGAGALTWNAAAKGRFVRLGAASGTVNEPWLEVSELSVGIVPSGLAPGQYYEQIEITGDADNSPQLVTVLLNVLPEGSNPGPDVTPSGMIFIAKQGENPGSQTVTLNHLGRGAATYDSSRLGTWYETAPGYGRALPDAPGSVVIQPSLSTLAPGVRRGVVTFQMQEDGSVRTVNMLAVVAPPDAGNKDQRYAASCASPALRVESTAVRDGFSVRVGEAVTVEIKAADECGNLLTPLAGGSGAQVVARPENGDPQVTLAHVGNGVWRGTWRPVRAVANTRLTIVAVFLGTSADVIAGRGQAGKVELSGSVLAQGATSAPVLTAGGVVHAASFESGVPIAPGSLITLYGSRLADSTGSAAGIPLPSSLNGTEVSLGNRPLPLLFTSDGQLNAQIPYDVSVDTQHQISVKRGEAIAVPETLTVSAAQPGVFTKSQTGTGQGAIVKQDGVTLAEPGTPANRGEVIVIYCSGLGPVSPAVEAGRPAPSSPLSGVVNPVTVTIGGQQAQVLFAGLAPSFSGLYQINAFVPAASATGDAVEVVIESAGQRSRTVTIAVR
ncbi:MAG: BACON domain-containing protein [Bryobacteraceae bacterium]